MNINNLVSDVMFWINDIYETVSYRPAADPVEEKLYYSIYYANGQADKNLGSEFFSRWKYIENDWSSGKQPSYSTIHHSGTAFTLNNKVTVDKAISRVSYNDTTGQFSFDVIFPQIDKTKLTITSHKISGLLPSYSYAIVKKSNKTEELNFKSVTEITGLEAETEYILVVKCTAVNPSLSSHNDTLYNAYTITTRPDAAYVNVNGVYVPGEIYVNNGTKYVLYEEVKIN